MVPLEWSLPLQASALWLKIQRILSAALIGTVLFSTIIFETRPFSSETTADAITRAASSSSIAVSHQLLEEGAIVTIYDPLTTKTQIMYDLCNQETSEETQSRISIAKDPYEAAVGAHAILVCTEWDIFKTLDYHLIYNKMAKPAFIFDGRLLLNHEELRAIGFHVEAIGKRFPPSRSASPSGKVFHQNGNVHSVQHSLHH